MKTVDPGQIVICRQKSTSAVLYGHVNPFARNLEKRSCQLFYYCVHMAEKTTSLCYVSFYVRCSVFHLGYVSLYVRCSVLDLPAGGSRVLCTCTADIIVFSPRIRVRMCMREEYFLLWNCFLHELFRTFRLMAWLISFRRC